GNGLVPDINVARGAIWGQHVQHHVDGNPRFATQPADEALTGIEERVRPAACGHRVIVAVVIPDAIAKLPVAPSAARGLNPHVFVWWNTLRGHLSADPIGLFGKNDGLSHTRSRQSCGDPSNAASDDKNVGGGSLCHPANSA